MSNPQLLGAVHNIRVKGNETAFPLYVINSLLTQVTEISSLINTIFGVILSSKENSFEGDTIIL